MSNSYCVVIPSFGHWALLPQIVDALILKNLPVIVVDDGNAEDGRTAIINLGNSRPSVEVIRLEKNCGKGVAVRIGLERAFNRGFSHALQIDADGQHDLSSVEALMNVSELHPDALVSGRPIYDETVPRARKIGRWVTHVWVFIETLSLRIVDSMCGFRIYPLATTLNIFARDRVGKRMDFDTDIMVRMFWCGVAPVFVPVRVTYPVGNRSNFRMWEDNVLISLMHTRLVSTMIYRLGTVLRNRPPRIESSEHWAALGERGARWGLRLTSLVSRLFGRRLSSAFLLPIVFYFWVTGAAQRKSSDYYLCKVLRHPVGGFQTYLHFYDFALRALDAFRAWTGQIPHSHLVFKNEHSLANAAEDSRGALLIVSHHGNVEVARALLSEKLTGRLTSIVHTKHALNYNRLIAHHIGDDAKSMIQVTDFGPETAVLLQERIARGEWIAIAGDRTPVGLDGRVCTVDFLGEPAPFPQGPWVLANLLACPVYVLFCTRDGNVGWTLTFDLLTDRVRLPRACREEAVRRYICDYAHRLEEECHKAPLQWYNFFDFWHAGRRA